MGEVSTVLTNLVTIIFLWQQNQIFKKQNEIFAVQAGLARPEMRNASRPWLKEYWPFVAWVFLAFLTLGVLGYGYYQHHPSNVSWWKVSPLLLGLGGFLVIRIRWSLGRKTPSQNGTPRLLCKGVSSHPGAITFYEDDMSSSPLVTTARVVGTPVFYHLNIANEPTGTVDRKIAEKVAGRVQVLHENGSPAAKERLHRWWNSPGPREVGKSADQLVAIDIPPNGVECNLDIAMKYEDEDSFYTPNNETAMWHGRSGWREEDFKFPPGIYIAKVHLSGTNVVTDLRCQIVNKGIGSKLEITPL